MDCPFLPPPAQIASAGQLNKIKQTNGIPQSLSPLTVESWCKHQWKTVPHEYTELPSATTKSSGSIGTVGGIRDSWGHSYFNCQRWNSWIFMKDEQLRKHLPKMFSLIKNETAWVRRCSLLQGIRHVYFWKKLASECSKPGVCLNSYIWTKHGAKISQKWLEKIGSSYNQANITELCNVHGKHAWVITN